jgi:hypothetical protein
VLLLWKDSFNHHNIGAFLIDLAEQQVRKIGRHGQLSSAIIPYALVSQSNYRKTA